MFDVLVAALVGRAVERGDLSHWPLKCQRATSSVLVVGQLVDTASKSLAGSELE